MTSAHHRRLACRFGFMWVTLVASSGVVLTPAHASSEATIEAEVEPKASTQPWLGLVLDAGVPDGAQVGVVVRPLSWLRVHAGAGYNLASVGIRGGVTYVPFRYWVVPTLVVEGGHYFPGSVRGAINTVAGVDVDFAPERMSYSFANAHLGLEFGGDWYTIFLRGGYSYVNADIRAPESDGVQFQEDVRVSAWAPSAKLGFMVYVY